MVYCVTSAKQMFVLTPFGSCQYTTMEGATKRRFSEAQDAPFVLHRNIRTHIYIYIYICLYAKHIYIYLYT